MEQRRLRLGDILDDYCPRERRVTNHVVVAMIEDEIRQTRCTTCDAEHAYKGGKAPRRRKAESTAAPAASAPVITRHVDADEEHHEVDAPESPAPAAEAVADTHDSDADAGPSVDEGPVHRPLIRATLPRPEGIKTERPVPEFTIRQNGRGNGNFRGGGFSSKGRGTGVGGPGRPAGGPRFGRGPQNRGQGRGGATPGGFGRGPKKRSR
jgi:hypothetical protein